MGTMLVISVLVILAILGQGEAHRNMKMMKSMYSQFVAKHKRVHASPEEASRRFGIFVQSLQRIDELNKRNNGVTYGITKFADWTKDEFKKMLMPKSAMPPVEIPKTEGAPIPVMNAEAIPAEFDWRTTGGVTPVKDQDMCGGCWSFATVGVIESAYAIKTGQMLDLSEQQIIDCESGSSGCHGGSYPNALKWAVNHGVMKEAEYPFLDDDGPSCPTRNGNVFVKSVTRITPWDVEQMKTFISKTGPIALHFMVGAEDDFRFYKSGVYHPTTFDCDMADGSHAVLGIGYGAENGEDYWLIKNSWGAEWGDNGYFKMARGTDCCEIELRPYGATV